MVCGQPAFGPDHDFDGVAQGVFIGQARQVRLSAEVVRNVATCIVTAAVNKADRLLLPGMTANVESAVQERDDVPKALNRTPHFTPPGAEGVARAKNKRDPGRSERIVKTLTERLKLDAKQQTALRDFVR